jgi:hypothetical protein
MPPARAFPRGGLSPTPRPPRLGRNLKQEAAPKDGPLTIACVNRSDPALGSPLFHRPRHIDRIQADIGVGGGGVLLPGPLESDGVLAQGQETTGEEGLLVKDGGGVVEVHGGGARAVHAHFHLPVGVGLGADKSELHPEELDG